MGDLFASGGSSGYPAALDTATTQTDATPTVPFDATAARASKVNNLATAVINIETELGTDPAGTYSTVVARLNAGGDGGYYSVGLTGANNSGTPNTQYDFAADLVALRDPSATTVVIRTNTGTVTNNISTAGPEANGRDQSGAFSASSWIHFYWIWNGTTLATVSSATAPPTGPTLPDTYTHWAYIGAVRYNATPLLVATKFRGAYVSYNNAATTGVLLSAGSATNETAIDSSAHVPPNASFVSLIALISSTNTSAANQLSVRTVTGLSQWNPLTAIAEASGITQTWAGAGGSLPNVGQNFYYLLSQANGAAYLNCIGYMVPNGGS